MFNAKKLGSPYMILHKKTTINTPQQILHKAAHSHPVQWGDARITNHLPFCTVQELSHYTFCLLDRPIWYVPDQEEESGNGR